MIETKNWTMDVSVESLNLQKKKLDLDSDAAMMGCEIKNYTSFKKYKMQTIAMMIVTALLGIILGMLITL
jgi:hypothetical protein